MPRKYCGGPRQGHPIDDLKEEVEFELDLGK